MVEIRLERTIAAPVEQVFDWLAEPVNFAAAPLVLRGKWAKGTTGPGPGAVREVIGAGTWFREELTVYDRPRSYSYLILRSFPPFDHDGGTLTFTTVGDATRVDWLTSYTHAAAVGGKALEAVTRHLLRPNLLAILDACAKALQK
ncbi:SRPBCC family protein [Mycobacterium sherrisii]|uniref:Polyketide cyclase n=1 Tax=Mycobacterium sherrisii TaxID=243061 RepID=A0A1E3SXH3_9MYCO|nr:SRPBCC family protein [Mycobacterium sherrisii]MCV7029589.1 SRPBCC family protein [Mycobacterium sherrisii]MEC4763933.1 SRPBCC family protein [Mycobacterium sherrisii]ODR06811.1 polyketide cyclase [Mycobacterium sherrisii]ORW83592.1 polyketide cyclase [Mycobacterium sherrisii]